jgi:hypothetical protein
MGPVRTERAQLLLLSLAHLSLETQLSTLPNAIFTLFQSTLLFAKAHMIVSRHRYQQVTRAPSEMSSPPLAKTSSPMSLTFGQTLAAVEASNQ